MVVNELTTMDGFDLLLTEEVLEEGAFDIIKRAGNWAKKLVQKLGTSFKNIIKKVMDNVKKVLKRIANMGKRMFEAVIHFL